MATIKDENTSTPQGGGFLNLIVIIGAVAVIYIAIQVLDSKIAIDMTDVISSSIEEPGN